MSEIIAIIIAAIFGLWGYHKRLYPAWAFLFNVLVAAYLALVLTPAFLGAKQAGGIVSFLGPWANSAIMLVIFGMYFALSEILSKFYLTNTYCVSFPKWIDDFSGMILGFIGGYVIVNLLLFALAVSPLNNNSLIKKFIPDNDGHTIVKASRFISSFSLQCVDGNITKALQKITDLPAIVKPVEKKSPAKPESEKSATANKIQPDSNKVLDTNEQTEQTILRNIIIASNQNSKNAQVKIIPESNGILEVNEQSGNNALNEHNSVTLIPLSKD